MAISTIPSALLAPRLAALESHLPAALDGGVHAVHQARVASRRLREALPVLGPPAGARRLGRSLKHVKRVTRALGPVRELDVTLELLARVSGADPLVAPATRIVARLVTAERRRRREEMLAAIDHQEVRRTRDAVSDVVTWLLHHEDNGEWRPSLAARATSRAERMIETIYDVGLLFDPGRLHEVRIAAKKLRYTLELVGETKMARVAALVATLKKGQELLGELHDLEIVLLFVRAAELEAGPRQLRSLALLREQLERTCHREHARYLTRRPRLLGVCEAVPRLLMPAATASRVRRPSAARRRTNG